MCSLNNFYYKFYEKCYQTLTPKKVMKIELHVIKRNVHISY